MGRDVAPVVFLIRVVRVRDWWEVQIGVPQPFGPTVCIAARRCDTPQEARAAADDAYVFLRKWSERVRIIDEETDPEVRN